ncbi:Kinase [Meloidogyne graminicola]|uniref:Kinase n=1 Tax=Meloidogyne graminicola TaxID=189291 RepID=A0A8T0A3I0_9BILA|nr:Kinase [Meloidogyne graminicola]
MCYHRNFFFWMEIGMELPPNLEWYEDQIAGHHPSTVRNGVRQIGIIKERGKENIILKLVQSGNRGEREVKKFLVIFQSVKGLKFKVEFYRRVDHVISSLEKQQQNDVIHNGNNPHLLVELAKFLPRQNSDSPKEFLQLEDDPNANEEKKMKEDSKCPLQKLVGFRILGYRVHTETQFYSKDRIWGRERTLENLQQAFEEYLIQALPTTTLNTLDKFIERLKLIQKWFLNQKILHFYASSLLLVYEGHSQLPPVIDIRMIDFSHVFSVEKEPKLDENYIYGLIKIIEMFEKIRNEHELKNGKN